MTPEDLKHRARRIIEEVYNQGDLAVADELISPDYIHHVPGEPPSPGIRGVKELVQQIRRSFPDFHASIEDEVAEGDRVVQRISGRGTHEDEFFDIPATGGLITFHITEINRVGPDGKFAEHWSSVDLLSVLQQLKAIPAPAAKGDSDHD
jgi:predicted ester cyclase